MYKQYKHRINLLIARNIVFFIAGITTFILITLLILEQHEDRILNEQAIRLDQKFEAGFHKASFSLYYNGGEIWCEHLDSLGDHKQQLLEKFASDMKVFNQIMMPTLVAVNLDETKVDAEIMNTIIKTFNSLKQELRKVVFVGLSSSNQRMVKKMIKKRPNITYLIYFINDFEKAKEWLI